MNTATKHFAISTDTVRATVVRKIKSGRQLAESHTRHQVHVYELGDDKGEWFCVRTIARVYGDTSKEAEELAAPLIDALKAAGWLLVDD